MTFSTVLVHILRGENDTEVIETSSYGYTPTQWICYVFVALFGVSALFHTGIAIRYKMWWIMATFFLCSVSEVIGWAGRVWSSYDVLAQEPFKMQLCCTIFAPTFTLAGLFGILGQVIVRLGPAYSRISPKLYSLIFVTCDFIALGIQAVGGGIASDGETDKGGDIMMGGIGFQLFVLTVAVIFALEYFIRYFYDKPVHQAQDPESKEMISVVRGHADIKMLTMIGTMVVVTFFLYIRAVYRLIELADGWEGEIITTEVYFNIFDGAMIVLVQFILAVFNPGWLLSPRKSGVNVPNFRFSSPDTTV